VPTIDEIAERANVSKTTVSFVINGRPGISAETVALVRRVMAEMNYVPSALAQRFASKKSKTVALVALPYGHVFSDLHHGQALDAVYETLDVAGYSLLLATSNTSFVEERRFSSMLRSGQVDGMLLLEPTLDQGYLGDLAAEDAPVAIINSDAGNIGLDYVRTDDVAVGCLAAESLLKLGHREFGFIAANTNHASARDRSIGFIETVRAAGVAFDSGRVFHGTYETSHWSGSEGCGRILREHPDTTAIFCSNDTMAIGALEAAQKAGRRVPGDLSIMGVDDIPAAMYCNPPMTSIRQPSDEVARQATQILIDRLTSERTDRRLGVGRALPPTLIARDSTAPPP
jgi:DNA-binding LacI/PurR family transcriptional regulator